MSRQTWALTVAFEAAFIYFSQVVEFCLHRRTHAFRILYVFIQWSMIEPVRGLWTDGNAEKSASWR
jgi:hypothetical protein